MRAVHPFKGSIDIHVVDIIMELAGESDGIQGVAVDDGVLAQRRCAGGSDPVLRADLDGQRDVLIVCALDHYGHCAHRAGGFHVIFLNGQGQLAVFHLRAAGVVAVI